MITSFYINRTQDVDRKLYMERELSRLLLTPERVSAITLGSNRESRMKSNTRSHQKAVRRAYDRNIFAALIMEDDCQFSETFVSCFDEIIEEALNLPVNVVYFGGELNGPAKRHSGRFSVTHDGVWGTHCYLVKAPVYAPILNKRSELAFDSVLMDAVRVGVWLMKFWCTKLNLCLLFGTNVSLRGGNNTKTPLLNTYMTDISCVMVTYGRATCVQRSIAMFLAQDFAGVAELIIFSTDEDHPYCVGNFDDSRITIINNNTDYVTGKPYTDVGSIRRDALTHAKGQYYVCWDDDDVFLPWNLRQAHDGILKNGLLAWKPKYSLFRTPRKIELSQNTMEASLIVNIRSVREYGFDKASGPEHLSWYTALRDQKQLQENFDECIPGYCFNWADPKHIAGHKQSGNIDNPNNYTRHREQSTDFPIRPLMPMPIADLRSYYEPFYQWFRDNHRALHPESFYVYAKQHTDPSWKHYKILT